MVDEKKAILMTKLAIFEKHEKNKSLVISKYYRSDYVRYNVLKTWVAVTVLYWSLIAGYIFMAFDSILEKLNDLDYFAIMYKMLGGYVLICAVYFLFSFILYNYRYKKAKDGLVQYNINLKELIHADDTPQMKKRLVDETKRSTDNVSEARAHMAQSQRVNVSRSDMIQRQLQEQQERKNQEIIENVKRRNERISAQKQEELQRQQEMEEERRRIRARRQQLEREQLQKIRQEQQGLYRENHVYNTNTSNRTGRGENE